MVSKRIRPSKSPGQADIIILVLGSSGVGKSTLINHAAGRDCAHVCDDLTSCTKSIEAILVQDPQDASRNVVFIDTPGFDDTYVQDIEIRQQIKAWLKKNYGGKKNVSSILYLYDISQTRMQHSPRAILHGFNALCADRSARNVVVVTTKWQNVPLQTGEERETQLSTDFLGDFLPNGSRPFRFQDSHESVWHLVRSITFCSSGETRIPVKKGIWRIFGL